MWIPLNQLWNDTKVAIWLLSNEGLYSNDIWKNILWVLGEVWAAFFFFFLFPLSLIQTWAWLNKKILWLVTSPSDRRFSEELRCPARSVENTDGPIKASTLPAEPLASDKSAPRWLRQRLYFKQALHSRPALKFFPVSSHPVLSSNHLITMHLMEELKGKHKCQRCRAPWPQWQEFSLSCWVADREVALLLTWAQFVPMSLPEVLERSRQDQWAALTPTHASFLLQFYSPYPLQKTLRCSQTPHGQWAGRKLFALPPPPHKLTRAALQIFTFKKSDPTTSDFHTQA